MFEIVTPMFLGGADQQAGWIRESSVKGALAFWWRALNFARFVEEAERGGKAGEDALKEALKNMQVREQALFGGGDHGQGAFLLRVSRQPDGQPTGKGTVLREAGTKAVGPGARYMAGQGLMDRNGQLVRSCIGVGGQFELDLVVKRGAQDVVEAELLPALKLFGLIGGLGSRVRRGWGSVALTSITGYGAENEWTEINDATSFSQSLQKLLGDQKVAPSSGSWPDGQEFGLTAFAKESRIWVAESRWSNDRGGNGQEISPASPEAIWPNALEALDWLGRALLNYRAWGRGGKVGDQPVQQQFVEDHNWFFNAAPGVDIPYRTAFGLPHNYFKYIPGGAILSGSVNKGNDSRRGSPMSFHVHRVGEQFIGVVSVFPTKFIDGDITAKTDAGGGAQTRRPYSLADSYGGNHTSGLDVLLDFVGAGTGAFAASQVLSFKQIFPSPKQVVL